MERFEVTVRQKLQKVNADELTDVRGDLFTTARASNRFAAPEAGGSVIVPMVFGQDGNGANNVHCGVHGEQAAKSIKDCEQVSAWGGARRPHSRVLCQPFEDFGSAELGPFAGIGCRYGLRKATVEPSAPVTDSGDVNTGKIGDLAGRDQGTWGVAHGFELSIQKGRYEGQAARRAAMPGRSSKMTSDVAMRIRGESEWARDTAVTLTPQLSRWPEKGARPPSPEPI